MLKKILPILAVSIWAVSGIADDSLIEAKYPEAESSVLPTCEEESQSFILEEENFADSSTGDEYSETIAIIPEPDEDSEDLAGISELNEEYEELATAPDGDENSESLAVDSPKEPARPQIQEPSKLNRVAKRTAPQQSAPDDEMEDGDCGDTRTCVAPCEKPACPAVKSCEPCKPKILPCQRRAVKVCAPACCPPPPCCWDFNPCNPRGCTDMNCGGFNFTGDFLYWRAENHGYSYGYELTASGGQNQGKMVRMQPSWDPGFRVGAGWNSKYDFWDVMLGYTWYENTASERKTSTNGFIQLWPLSTATSGEFAVANANTRFMLNIGDLEVGRLVFLTKSLALRPHLGARGGTVHQKFQNIFTNPFAGEVHSQESFIGKNNYWGLGPRFGFDGEWHLAKKFSFIGQISGALLYGQNNVSAIAQNINATTDAAGLTSNYSDEYYQLAPNLQIALGFQWQRCFWCETMFFKVSASWETNYWWNQFNLPVGLSGYNAPLPTVGNQPLTTEGLTINMEWGF